MAEKVFFCQIFFVVFDFSITDLRTVIVAVIFAMKIKNKVGSCACVL